MADIPQQTLSEHLGDRLSGYQSKTAVFLTFEFEPAFFEDHILPILLDAPLSQVPKVRRAQLEDAIAQRGLKLAVYYHAQALVLGDGSACLDTQRIPLRPKAFFHSKLILVIGEHHAEDGQREQHLFVGAPSANLTQNGWWKNVEACYFERLTLTERSFIAKPLRQYLKEVRRLGDSKREHTALDEILKFLGKVPQAQQKSSNGVLLTQFFGGTRSFPEFIQEATKGSTRLIGMRLEVISPFINKNSVACLDALIEATNPVSVTVARLHTRDGECFVEEATFDAIDKHPLAAWGDLISKGLGLGRDVAARRFVHAKIYRFWQKRPAREVIFVGSPNLTQAAHQTGGNHECGFLVELERPVGAPWLSGGVERPQVFLEEDEDELKVGAESRHMGSQVEVRFDWRVPPPAGELRWRGPKAPGELIFRAQGKELFRRQALEPNGDWDKLTPDENAVVQRLLSGTSIVEVVGEEPEHSTYLLVQEENMSHKPSLLYSLTSAEILKYWSLLTVAQKENFLEKHLPPDIIGAEGAELAVFRERLAAVETMFDRVAGVYHAFARLEAHVNEALSEGKTPVAVYRLFGQKFDSLPRFLDEVTASKERDLVDRYLIYRCALQVTGEIQKTKAGEKLWKAHPEDAAQLEAALQKLSACREDLVAESPELGEFLSWFDAMFDARARPMEAAE
ncbi:MAG: hypothetical protein RJA70_2663 [Pseudomonadota bacterium]|jgi:hypothetical protein